MSVLETTRSFSESASLISVFGKHTPNILRKQILLRLMEQYLGQDVSLLNKEMSICNSSMQRFYGTLLFVDISGFTALSLRLNVEELKTHINNYFTKMLDIVQKHGGDVIKFAGDALFIAWPIDVKTNMRMMALHKKQSCINGVFQESSFSSQAAKLSVEKAVACGAEITMSCSNFRIDLQATNGNKSTSPHDGGSSTSLLHRLLPSLFNNNSTTTAGAQLEMSQSMPSLLSPKKSASEEESVTYLNVHTGEKYSFCILILLNN